MVLLFFGFIFPQEFEMSEPVFVDDSCSVIEFVDDLIEHQSIVAGNSGIGMVEVVGAIDIISDLIPSKCHESFVFFFRERINRCSLILPVLFDLFSEHGVDFGDYVEPCFGAQSRSFIQFLVGKCFSDFNTEIFGDVEEVRADENIPEHLSAGINEIQHVPVKCRFRFFFRLSVFHVDVREVGRLDICNSIGEVVDVQAESTELKPVLFDCDGFEDDVTLDIKWDRGKQ